MKPTGMRHFERREKFDHYPTPASLVALLRSSLSDLSGSALEPCVGDGAIVGGFDSLSWETNDLSPRFAADHHMDASNPFVWLEWGSFDYVITNPPFLLAPQIVSLAYEASRIACVMLLRLSFLEPTRNRGTFLRETSDQLSIIIPAVRPTFRAGNRDSATAAWFVWGKEGRILPPFTYEVAR